MPTDDPCHPGRKPNREESLVALPLAYGKASVRLVHRMIMAGSEEDSNTLRLASPPPADGVHARTDPLKVGGSVLAYVEDTPVAAVRYRLGDESIDVERLTLLPEYRASGMTAILMKQIESVARDNAKRFVQISVRMSMTDQIRLYRKLGYRLLASQPSIDNDRIAILVKTISVP